MRHPIAAPLAAPETKEFCQKIVHGIQPVLLNNDPFPGAEEMDCF